MGMKYIFLSTSVRMKELCVLLNIILEYIQVIQLEFGKYGMVQVLKFFLNKFKFSESTSSEPLATIKQYRISFDRKTMVVDDNFPCNRGKLLHHIQLHEK